MTAPVLVGPGGVTQVKRGLQAAIAGPRYRAMLAIVQDEFADGLEMPALTSVERCERGAALELPYVEMLAVQSTPDANGTYGNRYDHVIAVRFIVGGSDEQLITDQAERYVLVFARMCSRKPGEELLLHPFVGSAPVQAGRMDYDPVLRHAKHEGRFMKVATIEALVTTYE